MEEIIKFLMPRINKEGYNIIIFAFAITFLCLMFFDSFGWVCLIGAIFCVYFFRDPERITPVDDHLVISPADGVVSAIERNADFPEELQAQSKTGTRVSIFLNVFNVHVNRIPVTGIVTKAAYRPGKFINASLDKSSKDNERQSVLINTVDGREVGLVQIAGLIARRIVCNVKDGDQVKGGSRYGIIKFGSRVDVFLPEGVEPAVLVGQTMVGGETVIARLNGEQKMITGTTE